MAGPEPAWYSPPLFAAIRGIRGRPAPAVVPVSAATGRDALVVTVWRVFNAGFIPDPPVEFDAACSNDVKQVAAQTAASGAALARASGFRSQARAIQGTPTCKAIVDTANDSDASLIVIGTHGARWRHGPGSRQRCRRRSSTFSAASADRARPQRSSGVVSRFELAHLSRRASASLLTVTAS